MIKFVKSLNCEYSNFSRLFKFIFSFSAFGVLLFVFGCFFDDVYSTVGAFLIISVFLFCSFLPFRLCLSMLFSVFFFVVLYLYFIVYAIRFSFYLWGF
jgi:hypothetical protein